MFACFKKKFSIKNIVLFLCAHGSFNWLSDKQFLEFLYNVIFHKKLNLNAPVTYNEKLQWLKLYDRNPMYAKLVDKYDVRKYVAEKIGEQYLIPLLGVWDRFEDIDFEKLPDQFVLKCTHDSGGLYICRDKSKLNIEEVKKKINRSLKRNYYYHSREWPYKSIKPRIICEKYMVDESMTDLKDYKFFCFDGVPRALYVASNRSVETRFDFYDMDFNYLPVQQYYKNSGKQFTKPRGFDEMVNLAKILSEGFPHVRVDFYDVNGKVYVGEMTFYHFGGFKKFEPESFDEWLGSWLILPDKKHLNIC
jgi:hypothetical protein